MIGRMGPGAENRNLEREYGIRK